MVRCAAKDVRRISSLESLFCYDKPIPEEIIEKPIGLALTEKDIGENPQCSSCQAKGALLCATCSGSGLYVDSILESQGIIVKVRCLGKVPREFLDIWFCNRWFYKLVLKIIIHMPFITCDPFLKRSKLFFARIKVMILEQLAVVQFFGRRQINYLSEILM